MNGDVESAARIVLGYLAELDPVPEVPADAVIGFGVFDTSLARHCGELYRAGVARRIIFTGGVGAFTGNLTQPEADAWFAELRRSHPDIPAADVILENRSTNTGENVTATKALLEREHPDLRFGVGICRAIVVAAPARLRRVRLTMRARAPGVAVYRRTRRYEFEEELALHAAQGFDYVEHLAGELDRIHTYAARGWIEPEPLPEAIQRAYAILRASRPN